MRAHGPPPEIACLLALAFRPCLGLVVDARAMIARLTENRMTNPPNALPLVALPADRREFENYSWHASPDQYARAALDAGRVAPVIIPAFGAAGASVVEAVLDAVSGVLVTGSKSNVHPSLYGHEPTPAHEPYDRDRDAVTMPLIRGALERGVPLLCVCRGIQELNVALGGTIRADIQSESRDDHRAVPEGTPDQRFALAHEIAVESGTVLADVIGENARVNSLHQQALDEVGSGLDVTARATDGTIEAVAVRDAKGFAIGVQWHPEYWARADRHRDTPSWAILEAWGDAVRAYAASR